MTIRIYKAAALFIIATLTLTGCVASNSVPSPGVSPSPSASATGLVLSSASLDEGSELEKAWVDAAANTFQAYSTSDIFVGSTLYKDLPESESVNFVFFVEDKSLMLAHEPTLSCKPSVIEVEPVFEGMFLPNDSGSNGLLYAGMLDDGSETAEAFATKDGVFAVAYKDWENVNSFRVGVTEGGVLKGEYSGTYDNSLSALEAVESLVEKTYNDSKEELSTLSSNGLDFNMLYSYSYDLSNPVFRGQAKERIQFVLERSYEVYEFESKVLFDFETDSIYSLKGAVVTDPSGAIVSGVCNV